MQLPESRRIGESEEPIEKETSLLTEIANLLLQISVLSGQKIECPIPRVSAVEGPHNPQLPERKATTTGAFGAGQN